jgi:hypothetical protein
MNPFNRLYGSSVWMTMRFLLSLFFMALLQSPNTIQAAERKKPKAIRAESIYIGSHRWLRMRFPKATSEPVVIFSRRTPLPIGGDIDVHRPESMPLRGLISDHSFFALDEAAPEIPCGYIRISADVPELPTFFLVTPATVNARGVLLREVPYAPIERIDEPIRQKLKAYTLTQLMKPTDGQVTKHSAQVAKQLVYTEEFAYREFQVPDSKRLIFAAFKMVTVPTSQDDYHLHRTPYHRHEIMGFLLGRGDQIEASFPVASLSWVQPEVRSELRRKPPDVFLDDTVLGVYDIEPDGQLEILLGIDETEVSPIRLYRLQKGKLLTTGVSFE